MRKTHTRLLRKITGLFLAGAMVAGSIATPLGTTKVLAQDTKSDDEIMLGVFFTSEEDTTDTLYWSKDGVNFYQLAEAYTDATPDDNKSSIIKYTAQDKAEYEAKYPNPEFRAPFARKDVTLHDPGIIYKDGYFWMISGNTTSDGYLEFMIGFSKDLERWSYPTQFKVKAPVNIAGTEKTGGVADMVAPDFMVAEDGTVYIVASLGYYASKHGGDPEEDVMQPYLIKISGLKAADGLDTDREVKATGKLEAPVAVNLPCMKDRANVADDHIDGNIFIQDGYYYLAIKENGVTNEIWKIKDINECDNADKWELVADDIITGYEGPCVTGYDGQYYMYVDRLSTYKPVDTDKPYGSAGIYVIKGNIETTGKLDKYTGWLDSNVKEVKFYDTQGKIKSAVDSGMTAQGTSNGLSGKTYNGARHGSVITLTGKAADVVIALAKKTNATAYEAHKNDTSKSVEWNNTGWYLKESYRSWKLGGQVVNYWYENGIRQGVIPGNDKYLGKEIYDETTKAWYWLEAKRDGAIAIATNKYDNNGNIVSSGYQNGDYEVRIPVDPEYFAECGYDISKYGDNAEAWVWSRYEWDGKKIVADKGEYKDYLRCGTDNWYKYDDKGNMYKGVYTYVNPNGDTVNVFYDTVTGVRVDSKTAKALGYEATETVLYTEDDGLWDDGQGGTSNNTPATLVKVGSALIAVDVNGVILSRNFDNTVPGDVAALPKFTYGVKKPGQVPEFGWDEVNGKSYWYEGSVKQGTYDDANGVIGDGTIRGREIYDPVSDGWYWLDACYDGAKAVSKEVWMPYIYQGEKNWPDEEIAMNAASSGDMAAQVTKAIKEGSGKWVRYDANGKMYKGWYTVEGADVELYPTQKGNTYYYDPKTGLMAKGEVTIDGQVYRFDEMTGALIK